tara:strand:- start:601 stop:1017 length:417 start_codon:yes stop_codon:yes gene_type:complete
VKKKYSVSSKDKNDWESFIKDMGKIENKDFNIDEQQNVNDKVKRLDLHGVTLNEANKIVKKFIIDSANLGVKKIIIITGKGSRSKVYDDPYRSKEMSVLKNSVPEFISTDKDLKEKIIKITKAEVRDGGEGAFYIFLK